MVEKENEKDNESQNQPETVLLKVRFTCNYHDGERLYHESEEAEFDAETAGYLCGIHAVEILLA